MIIVLGAGPVGMLAGQVLLSRGYKAEDIAIIEKGLGPGIGSESLSGAYFIHGRMDQFNGQEVNIRFSVCWPCKDYNELYARKVYLDDRIAKYFASKDKGYLENGNARVWKLRTDLIQAGLGESLHCNTTVERIDLDKRTIYLRKGGDERYELKWDLMVNTIPLPVFLQLCGNTMAGHVFSYRPIFIVRKKLAGSMKFDYTEVRYCADTSCHPWYRLTFRYTADGDSWAEEEHMDKPGDGSECIKKFPGKIWFDPERRDECLKTVSKIRLNLMYDNKIFCTGRYGKWQPGMITHEAYYELVQMLPYA